MSIEVPAVTSVSGQTQESDSSSYVDREAAVEQLEAMFKPTDIVEVRCVENGKDNAWQKWFRADDDVARDAVIEWAATINARGWDVFVGVLPRLQEGGGLDKDVGVFPTLFADFDDTGSVDEVLSRIGEASLPEPSMIVATGRGIHAYWFLTADACLDDWTAAIGGLINRLRSCTACKNASRVLRLAGFRNNKYPHRPVAKLIEAKKGVRHEISDLLPVGETAGTRTRQPVLNHLGNPAAGNDILCSNIPEGHRHASLVRKALSNVFRTNGFDRSSTIADMQEELWCVVQVHCKSSKPDAREITRSEIEKAVLSAVNYRKRTEAIHGSARPLESDEEIDAAVRECLELEKSTTPSVTGLESHGLKLIRHESPRFEEYVPGEWRLEIVESDPPEVRLIVPAWRGTPCGGTVALTLQDFLSPVRVAEQVFISTTHVILGENPKKWAAIWNGYELRDGAASVGGLRAKLVDTATRVQVGESSKRYASLAATLLTAVGQRAKPLVDGDSQDPDAGGRPTWRTRNEVWFGWSRTWSDIERTQKVPPREQQDLKRRLCAAMNAADFIHERFFFAGTRKSFVVFDHKWLEALQRLADGADGRTEGTEATAAESDASRKSAVSAVSSS